MATITDKAKSDKGHLISKCLFGTLNSSKKPTKRFDLTLVPEIESFSFIIWKN